MLGFSSCLTPSCISTAPTPADNSNICGAGTVTFSWAADALATGYDVYLNTGTAAPTTLVSANQPGTTYTATLALGPYTWQVIPKNSSGAPTGCSFWKFTVAAPVTPSITITSNNADTFCAGTPVVFSSTITNGGTAPFYQWKKNGTNVGTNSPTYTDNAIVNGDIVKAQLTSNSTACLTTNTVSSANDTIKSLVVAVPSVTVTANGNTTFCNGGSVNLSTATAATTYQWQKNGTNITGATTSSYTASATGNYAVKITVSGSTCGATSAPVAVNAVSVYPAINRTGNKLSTSSTYAIYQWYRGGVAIPGANNFEYIVTQDGSYYVKVTDNNGCEGTAIGVPVNNLAVGTIVNVEDIQIYPNPTTGMIQINTPVLLNIMIRDLDGKLVLQKKGVNKIDISSLVNGIYFMHLSDKNNNMLKVEKIVKADH